MTNITPVISIDTTQRPLSAGTTTKWLASWPDGATYTFTKEQIETVIAGAKMEALDRDRSAATLALADVAGLDAAWKEAEAALPEYWHIRGLEYRPEVGPDPWQASSGPPPLTKYVYAATPALALRALAAALRNHSR